MKQPISLSSVKGQEMAKQLREMFGIPECATQVRIEYAVNDVFTVTCSYFPTSDKPSIKPDND